MRHPASLQAVKYLYIRCITGSFQLRRDETNSFNDTKDFLSSPAMAAKDETAFAFKLFFKQV